MAINLLPQDYQKKLVIEHAQRLTVAIGFLILAVLAANIAMLLPFELSAVLQETELKRELEITKKSQLFAKVTDIEQTINALNSRAGILNREESERFEISPIIESIVSAKPAGIAVQNFFFSRDKKENRTPRLSISGTAANRTEFLNFVKANESNEFFKRVYSPISNLLKEQEINYSLVLELHDEP